MLRTCALQSLLLPAARAWSSAFEPRRFDFGLVARSAAEVRELLRAFFEDGLVVVDGLPRADEANATHSLAGRLLPEGHLPLEGAFWNVGHIERACLSDFTTGDLPHLAYNSAEIQVHTDGAYLPVPPRAKLMHVVRFDASGDSGDESSFPDNVFVDAFSVISGLSREEQGLLERPLHIRYNDDGESRIFEHMQPVLQRYSAECADESSPSCLSSSPAEKERYRVAWNSHDRVRGPGGAMGASGSGRPGSEPEQVALEAALDSFQRRAGAADAQLLARLVPGRAFLVDNWRVLHGRRGYSGGKRRLVGADFPQEALMGRWREVSSAYSG